MEKAIPIGTPGKNYKFDLAEATGNVVVECKCYTWTETGNVPSAKIRSINETAFFLSFLPDTMEKIIVMAKATHPKHKETLAEYYHRWITVEEINQYPFCPADEVILEKLKGKTSPISDFPMG